MNTIMSSLSAPNNDKETLRSMMLDAMIVSMSGNIVCFC